MGGCLIRLVCFDLIESGFTYLCPSHGFGLVLLGEWVLGFYVCLLDG